MYIHTTEKDTTKNLAVTCALRDILCGTKSKSALYNYIRNGREQNEAREHKRFRKRLSNKEKICRLPSVALVRTGLENKRNALAILRGAEVTLRDVWFKVHNMRDSAYAVPANKNSASEVSTLGIIAGVNPIGGAMTGPRPGGTAWMITVDLHAR